MRMMQLPKSSSELLVSTGVFAFIVLLHLCGQCEAELTPPYFNLAEGRKIYASSTCGVDSDGPELYCKLVGSDIETNINGTVINGQVKLSFGIVSNAFDHHNLFKRRTKIHFRLGVDYTFVVGSNDRNDLCEPMLSRQ